MTETTQGGPLAFMQRTDPYEFEFNNLADSTHFGHANDPNCDNRGLGAYPNHCTKAHVAKARPAVQNSKDSS